MRPRVYRDRDSATPQWLVTGAAARHPYPTWAAAYAAAEGSTYELGR